MKRFCCKISVQTIVITTIVAFIVLALGFIVNYALKDYDKAVNDVVNRIFNNKTDDENAVSGRFTSDISSLITLQDDSNRKIIGATLTAILFTVFYLTIVICLKRRQDQTVSTNISLVNA